MCKDKLSFAIFLLISLNTIQCRDVPRTRTDRTVSTSVGNIQGELDSNGGYYKFLGIPYGQVSQANPFGDSTEYPRFDDVFTANNDSVICPQMLSGEAVGSLDCLNLHVYAPVTATANSRLPVIIWIHGGYFMRGMALESLFGPKYLVRHDVIVVAINYRTGPFGFMCLGIDNVPGNQGLKDQQLAFQWVHTNIEAFGGNREHITLAGHSAGAHSIDLHLISQRDKLYNQIIMQSGSSLVGTVIYEPDREAALKIAENLGLTTTSSREAVSLLATQMDVHSIMKAANDLNIQFKPCVETEFEGGHPFISHSWINAPVEAANISVLIGFNEYERMGYHINKGSEHFENLDVFTQRLNHIFDFNDTRIVQEDRLKKMEDYVRRFYMGDKAASQDTLWPIINFDSDFVYVHPMQRSIKKYLTGGANDIFYYMFAYSGGRNHRQDWNNVTIEGTSHGDELAYLFEMSHLSGEVTTEDLLIIDRMTTMWTNFAKYGNPTPEITSLLPVKWTPLTSEIYHYMKIDSNSSMEKRPFNRRMAFLDLFYKYNEDFQRLYDDQYYEEKDDEDHDDGSGMNNSASLTILLSGLLVLVFRQ